MNIPFVPGLELGAGLYRDHVAPVLDQVGLIHSAGLIGSGSEILGFDDEVSRDHHWGPRVMVFVRAEEKEAATNRLSRTLADSLPKEYRRYSTNFSAPDPEDHGTQLLQPIKSGPVNHRVEFHRLPEFLDAYVGADFAAPLDPLDWLSLPTQKLRTLVSGRVFRDDLTAADAGVDGGLEGGATTGCLAALRRTLGWYPDPVWRYLLAAGWARIGQEEHLMGRAGQAGDELGSALIAGRLVRDIMRLAFLMERQYPPYPKWFGTAFSLLNCGPKLGPAITQVLGAQDWQGRDAALVGPYQTLAQMHNSLGLTAVMPEEVRLFHGRPFRVMAMHGFSEALLDTISQEDWLRPLLRRSPFGGIDLVSDNTDFLEEPGLRRPLAELLRRA